ncbi:glycerol kinase GlpK [Psychroserpens sp.]|uniref:glycerol kinase GlpK n=1 Tax=Psychroserpens sp. TaxID=2020870 RepID=UPI003C720B9C
MSKRFILALDQGTTSSRALLVNHSGEIVASSHRDFKQIFPKVGWVEHDPEDIWRSQLESIKNVMQMSKITSEDIAAIGITNQRETVVVWNRKTGQPIYNAIVWQDRRTAAICDQLKSEGYGEEIKQKTGLVIDPYFSASKIKWILDHVDGSRISAKNGDLCFGTIDSWLIWKLTDGKRHLTDVTNASRTMIFDIHKLQWDASLLALFDIPKAMLPEVKECAEIYAETAISQFSSPVKIAGVAGDQQAALVGQLCLSKGMAKNTYGTGCFLLMNTGKTPVVSNHELITTIAYQIQGQLHYALEGSIFIGGAAVQWLRDGLELINNASEIENLAASTTDNGGVYFVPALTGLGAPYWNPHAKGMVLGISRGTTQAHLARATLEGIAFQVYDVVKAMEEDSGQFCKELRVDGGASANDLLMQFQSDIFNCKVKRPKQLETTALGAAYLAGLTVNFWSDLHTLEHVSKTGASIFKPNMDEKEISYRIERWQKAVDLAQQWT